MRFLCRLIASIYIMFTAITQPVLCLTLAYLLCRYFSSNDNQYCTSNKPVEHQLSMRFLCWMIASISIMFTAITQPVLWIRLAYLLYRYFSSNDNQYCTSNKLVEHQLSMRFLRWLIASISIMFTAVTQPVLCLTLAYLLCRYFSSNDNQYCTSNKPVEHQLSTRFLCRFIASISILFTVSNKTVLFWRLAHFLCEYSASNSNQCCVRI